MSEGDEVGKIFVGGLTRETTDDMLRQHFSNYGEIVECIVMRDKLTQMSRGFGFVKYADAGAVAEVLKNRPHTLDNKKIDPKPCTPKTIQQQKKNAQIEHTQTHKIFIGGLAQNATEEEVKAYFSQYGSVTEVVFVINKEENRHKGFGFVTFESESAVDQAVGKHFHEICGKRVEAKRATPRETMRRNQNDGNDGYSGGGGGGGYGYGYPNSGGGGGWMGQGSNGGMMGGFGYPPYGQSGYGGNYPYGQTAQYYGYNYNTAPGMMYGGQGGAPNKGDASGGYGGMGSYQQQTPGGYGPTRGQSYSDYGNGYGRGGDSSGGGGRGSGQGYHPYKR
uniref:Deleted in azoospermia (Daz)-associated protein 1 n=1 Tax=Botryllus schlosseri TaxID=30301 RepID=G2ZH19_BOTSH|nr:deleted in azoospermia (Daz)-associated protein 1 [Botryllus schlosseri]